jgi:hypothetical protein
MATIPRKTHQWLLLLMIDVTVPTVIISKHHTGEVNTTIALTSAFLSLLVLNVVTVLTTRSRNKRLGQETPRKFYLGAACLAVISGVLTTLAVHSAPVRNDYLELALSDTPLNEIQPKRKALVVELVRRIAEDSKVHERVASQFKPISPALYSPDSFANEKVIRSVSEQYKKAFDMDVTYHKRIETYWREFHEKMLNVDPDFLKSFEAASQKSKMPDERVFQLQQQLAAATLDLYGYADSHSRELTVSDGKLHFANEDVRVEFSRRLEESKSLYQHCQDAVQELIRKRQQSRKSYGISPNAQDWR